ncbi:MAG: hypothetical protein LQ348_006821 [Seirophora lacunosa]|nr:MAG: hypothetical protein LQ348_006821 [Seirophora lacunosa]
MVEVQRLYVSPLDPHLLHTVLSSSLCDSARNVSYHTLQTFPERRYGYLELPILEADRLKKKLHGFILQGERMKVEKARSEKTSKGSGGSDDTGTEERPRQRRRSTGHQKENEVLAGVELPANRKIKRGWTEPSSTKRKESTPKNKAKGKENAARLSAHTDGPECLFKTTVPSNAVQLNPSESMKPKKRKRGETEKKVVIHEFEKTIKHPSFIRGETIAKQTKSASSYVEGKGWVDDAGNVIEAEKENRRTRSGDSKTTLDTKDAAGSQKSHVIRNTTSGSSRAKPASGGKPTVADDTSSSGSSSSGSEGVDQQNEASSGEDSDQKRSDKAENDITTDQVRALSITRSSPTPPLEPVKEVHPLEMLFKRPKCAASQTPQKPSLEVKTGFSFFEADEEPNGTAPSVVPQTPFTQQDFQERRLRSAAPTPDTAAPSKTTFGRLWPQESRRGGRASDEGEDDAESTPIASKDAIEDQADGTAKESEFAKWFYEHRGETNRAWKRRRREAAKEKRQKENKRR